MFPAFIDMSVFMFVACWLSVHRPARSQEWPEPSHPRWQLSAGPRGQRVLEGTTSVHIQRLQVRGCHYLIKNNKPALLQLSYTMKVTIISLKLMLSLYWSLLYLLYFQCTVISKWRFWRRGVHIHRNGCQNSDGKVVLLKCEIYFKMILLHRSGVWSPLRGKKRRE